MSQQAAVIKEAGAQLELASRPIPKPAERQILVRNHAVAMNPVDWKIQAYKLPFLQTFPNVLGCDVSGTVEHVGSAVTHFKPGDRVAGFTVPLLTQNADDGAFQEYSLVLEHCAARIPDTFSFMQGAVLPVAVATAGIAVYYHLALAQGQKQSGAFLVWGGSSSVGTAAVQIAHDLGFTVFATASPANHAYVEQLGATAVFDYKDKDVVSHLVSAARDAGLEIKYGIDAIAGQGSSQLAASVLAHFPAGGKLALTGGWPEDAKQPDGVEISSIGALKAAGEASQIGAYLFNDWLEKALDEGRYVPSPEIQVVKGGLAAIQEALDIHKKGLSGKKLVVPLI